MKPISNTMFMIEENETNQHQRIQEIGEVKKGFTYQVERSSVLKRAEMFLPMLGLSNQYVQKGSCEQEIIETNEEQQKEEEKENKMEEDHNEKEEKCYVEMNVALGILEHQNEESEEELMIEELN